MIARILYICLLSLILQTSAAAAPLRFAFGSCNYKYDETLWKSIYKKSPEFVLLLGDNIYADENLVADRKSVKKAYDRFYATKYMSMFREQIPLYAAWDDNETGLKDSDSSNPFLDSLEEFHFNYWDFPSNADFFSNSVAMSFERGDVLFIVTDNRSFRRNYDSSTDPQMFGAKQLDWIEQTIADSDAKFFVLSSGNQMLTNDVRYEALRQYPKEFKRILRILITADKPFVIVSGDRHFAEILALKHSGQEILEITSSPFTAPLAPDSIMQAESLRLGVSNKHHNFGLVSIDTEKGVLHGQILDREGNEILAVRRLFS